MAQKREDCLTLKVKSLTEFLSNQNSSKRLLLQAVSKILDPLGMLTPFTIRTKILFQELWLKKIPWDGNLPLEIQNQWLKHTCQLLKTTTSKIFHKAINGNKNLNQLKCNKIHYYACIIIHACITNYIITELIKHLKETEINFFHNCSAIQYCYLEKFSKKREPAWLSTLNGTLAGFTRQRACDSLLCKSPLKIL